MYLQSLEMIGFKSFAHRTVLNFHRGVTAVVGPNGCGKSNVLDALRWVLGEQSAKALRGGEMADVIFSGTDSKAALGMAEVSMTFCECEKELGLEWNEVRITRRVHRDGKSEYFINKAPCRLKDIHQLFMDTGVGRSAYSIMEQGKIDLILSSRPEDRRAIFEEAAGITKYKAQKKEALRKLEYTEANLIRVQDIIKEVKRQIGSLQRQAAKARRYQGIMQDLRTFDTHLSHKNYLAHRGELKEIREELHRAEQAREIHEREISEQETELHTFRSQISDKDAEIAGLHEQLQSIRNEVFSSENRMATNTERVAEGTELVERHRADIAAAEEKILVQKNQIEETDQQIASMLDAITSRQSELAVQEEKVAAARTDRAAMEQAIGQLAGESARLEAKIGSLRGEISTAAGRREAGETRHRLLQGESEAADAACEEIKAKIEALTKRRTALEEELQAAQTEQTEASRAHQIAQNARQETEYAFNAASKEAASLESRLEILRQLQEQGEGFDEGTQILLKGLDDPALFKPGILGALADQIRVEERYIPAVEAALGNVLQAVLFKDPTTARAAIETLTNKKLGRAAAIPRDWVPGRVAQDQPLPERAHCWAEEIVGGDGEGATLAKTLLARTIVVESLDDAFRIRDSRKDLFLVTLQGETIDQSGIIRGGQAGQGNGHSALARKAQIEALEIDLNSAIQTLESRAQSRSLALEAMENAQNRLLESKESVQTAQGELTSCNNEFQLCNRQLADIEARRAAFQRETAHIQEELQAAVVKIEELDEAIREALSDLESLRQRKASSEQDVQAAREREAAAAEVLNEVKVAVATSHEQQESLTRQRGPMAARLQELAEILESRSRDISNYERKISELEAESARLQQSVEALNEKQSTLGSQIAGTSAERDELRSQSEAVEIALKAARTQLLGLQDKKGKLEVRAAQVDMRMENLRNHVSQRYQTDLEAFEPDTYGLLAALRERMKRKPGNSSTPETSGSPEDNASQTTQEISAEASPGVVVDEPSETRQADPVLDPALPAVEEGIPWEKIEEMVAELTERVESMGPINLEAIQEFEELEQRQLFLEKQNADLVNSKVELMEVISKINRTTKDLFSDTFVKVRENFQVMFTELFGGGSANLLLVDESDPLESGIEIIAKPPGKQLKSVSLLSGGERTMTAVALLFGIYMVKPSPFCVLDEMDAPLDDSNISRFIKILDRFVDQSQFVVITHNKRTISRAEMLYGVTMEEHGISKLVSVRFNEHPDDRSQSVAEAFGKDGSLLSERAMT